MRKLPQRLVPVALLWGAVLAGPAQAEVERFEIVSRVSPAFGGAAFGDGGAYERIDGIAHLAIDPDTPRGERIVDLDRARVDDDGRVRFSTEVTILRPVDPARQNGALLYEVPNRGRNLMFNLLNMASSMAIPSTIEQAGDGHLMARGYTIAWSGWQHGLPEEAMQMHLPVLPGLEAMSREEIIFDAPGRTGTLDLTYPAADQDPSRATLSVRLRPEDARSTVAGLSFRYLSASSVEITRPEGLDAGAIFEFVYPATDAVPAGLALAATSDVVSYLRGSPGHGAEPVTSGIDHTIGIGISQSGRYLRDLIWQGFNADEAGARVFDGAVPYIAGSRKSFTNASFAQPGRYSRHHEDHDAYGDQFPFTYATTTDPLTGETGSILDACRETETCPKLMHVDTSTEFWQARAALVSTSPGGEALEMPEDVRLYFMSGAPHSKPWPAESEMTELCRFPTNPLSAAPAMRALTEALHAWVAEDAPPPESRYPSLADGTLVPLPELNLEALAGEAVAPVYNVLRVRDHSVLPPRAGAVYPVWVPQLDADGLPLAGIRNPAVAAPLGTHLGWNLRAEGFAEGSLCGLEGSYLPFPATPEVAGDDPRRPLSARYADEAAYLEALEREGQALAEAGLMLPGDMPAVLERGRQMFAKTQAAE